MSSSSLRVPERVMLIFRRTAIPVVVLTGLLVIMLPGAAAANREWETEGEPFVSVHEGFTVSVGQEFTTTLATITFLGIDARAPDFAIESRDPRDGSVTNLRRGSTCRNSFLGTICDLFAIHTYERAGAYAIRIKVTFSNAESEVRLPIQAIDLPGPWPDPLDSFVLVSVGDSVASGEGAPTLTVPEVIAGDVQRGPHHRPIWNDGLGPSYAGVLGEFTPALPDESPCHQSLWAHSLQLELRLLLENPATRFTTRHEACSGGTTDDAAEQLRTAAKEVPQVDALLISAGANDRVDGLKNSFGDILVGKCLKLAWNCAGDLEARTALEHKFDDAGDTMAHHYAKLADTIEEVRRDTPIAQIYITEYYDPTRDDFGRTGGNFFCTGDLMIHEEWLFLDEHLMQPLNFRAAQAAARHSWQFVDGIANRFVNRGFCASDDRRFVANFWDSVNGQHDRKGTAHPNRQGQYVIADQIYHNLLRNQPPRTRVQGFSGGSPYQFGRLLPDGRASNLTWTRQDVSVTLLGQNLRGAGAERLSWKRWARNQSVWKQTDEGVVNAKVAAFEDPDASGGANVLRDRSFLTAGQSLWSSDARFRLTFQADGNLVLYRASDGSPVWASGTVPFVPGSPATAARLFEGQLHIDVPAGQFWRVGAAGNPGAYLLVQNDGNLAIYSADNRLLWSASQIRTTLSHQLTLSDGVHLLTFQSMNTHGVWERLGNAMVAIDSTPPVTTARVLSSPSRDDWHNTDVRVLLDAKDNGSGVDTLHYTLSGAQSGEGVFRRVEVSDGSPSVAGGPLNITQEGTTTIEYFSRDMLGNEEPSLTVVIKIDKTLPTITLVSRTPEPNEHGWNRTDITVTWKCEDEGPIEATVSKRISFFSIDHQSLEGTCIDRAGNTASHVQGDLKVDKIPPRLFFISREPEGNAAGWNNQHITVRWHCGDDLFGSRLVPSGLLSMPIVKTLSTEGANQSLEATCEDLAGNVVSDTATGLNLDKTPPTVQFGAPSPAANEAGWNNTPVLISFTTDDALSGVVETSIPSPLTLSSEGTGVTTTVTVKDAAGNSVSVESPAARIDMTRPEIALVSRLPATNAAGWNQSDITATWSCADAQSGPSVERLSKTLATEGRDQSLTGTCRDAAGNEAAHTVLALNLDKTPPSVVFGAPSPPPHASGWNNTPVSIPFTVADNLSGVLETSLPSPLALTSEGAAVTGRVTATDAAGNTTSAQSPVVRIDLTAPVLTLPAPFSVQALNFAGAMVSYTAAALDAIHGALAPQCLPAAGSVFPLGAGTVTCTVTDTAGNTASGSFVVDVKAPGVTEIVALLDQGIELRRLDRKLQQIVRAIDRERDKRACKRIDQLRKAIDDHRKLTGVQEAELLFLLDRLAELVPCN